MNNKTASKLPRNAIFLALSEGISSLGVLLTSFGLDIWVFHQTGSYTVFALLAVIAALPGLVFSPFAGVITDRFSKKHLLLACEVVSLIVIVFPLVAIYYDFLSVEIVAATIVLLSLAETVRWPALSVSISIITPTDKLGNINGLVQSMQGIVLVSGPMFGALLYQTIGLISMLILDGLTYIISILFLLKITIKSNFVNPKDGYKNLFSGKKMSDEIFYGFRWINREKGLKRLLAFFVFFNMSASVFSVTYTPYILSFLSSNELGFSLSLTGIGMVMGGALFMQWGGPKKQEWGVVGGVIIASMCMTIWGLTRDLSAIYVIAFIYGFVFPIINASSQTIWQSNVPIEIQGKVFSVRKMIAWGLNPIAILVSIPFAVYVFEPLVGIKSESGIWLFGSLWGPGQTGALGMMISIMGFMVLFGSVLVILRGGLRMDDLQQMRHVKADCESDVEIIGETMSDSKEIFKVVRNINNQYSIWPNETDNPIGWYDDGKVGLRDACLEYIRNAWHDMRPAGMQETMASKNFKNYSWQ